MGEQVMPIGVVKSCTTTPMDFRRFAAVALLAGSTDWQHWIGAVLHVSPGVGVAAARIATAAMVTSLANIMVMYE